MCRQIEGWSNYPTYAWRQWNMSEAGSYHFWEKEAQEILRTTPGKDGWTDVEASKLKLADAMKEDFELNRPDVGAGANPYDDILGWAIGQINWYSIAESWIDGIIEEQQRGANEP